MGVRLDSLARRILALPLLLLALHGPAGAEDIIRWGWHHRPPLSISEGTDTGHGAIDLARRQITDSLPGYRHVEVKAPIARILREIKSGEHWCVAGLLRTPERDAFTLASLPIYLAPGHRLIVRSEDRQKFGPGEPVSLESVLSNTSLRALIERDRSYGPVIDELLSRHPEIASFPASLQGVRMLMAGRFDYLLERESTAFYYARQLGDPQRLIGLPFKEMPDALLLRVLCPRNRWGAAVIGEINQALLKIRPTPEYRRIMEMNLGPDAVAALRLQYGSRFLDIE